MSDAIQARKTGITDATLRDIHQSLLATRVHAEGMLPICDELDRVDYWSLEVWDDAIFDAYVCFLKEGLQERLRRLEATLLSTCLQMLLRGQNLLGYRYYNNDVVRTFVVRTMISSTDVLHIFDAMNDVRSLRVSIEAVEAASKHAQDTTCYTASSVHIIEVLVAQGKAMTDIGVDSVAAKDVAGLLIPYATGDLIKALKDALSPDVVVHSRDAAGVVSMCQLRAVENDADRIDTTTPSMVWDASHPGTESIVAALRGTPYDTGLDLELIRKIGVYLHTVRRKCHQFESELTGVNAYVQANQMPNEMISNLANQLREQDALSRMGEVLEEIPRVRTDLGFPPLMTPTPQTVGTQAFLSVLAGERYKTITNEVKLYLQGRYGRAPDEINKQLRRQAIGSEEVINVCLADLIRPELDKLHSKVGNLTKPEEDTLTCATFPDIERKFLKECEAGILKPKELLPVPTGKGIAVAGVESTPIEFVIDVRGETYRVDITEVGVRGNNKRRFYLSTDGMPEEVVFESLNEYIAGPASGRKHANEPGRANTTMPDNIISVLVKEGDNIRVGQTVLITEAMKMETEVRAGIAGTVEAVHVAKGDRVNPDEILTEIAGRLRQTVRVPREV